MSNNDTKILIDNIKSKIDIVDLISQNVTLKKKSGNFVGCCPFHSEKTPSFTIYPETQSYYCFGCGAKGDVLTYHEKYNQISTGETIKHFKEILNIDDTPLEVVRPPVQIKKDYVKPEVITKIWDKQEEYKKDNQSHQDELLQLAPNWAYNEAHDKDIERFFNIYRYNKHEKTGVILLNDYHGTSKSMKYRRKEVDERTIKWYSLPNTESDILFTSFNDDSIGLVVEGSHDFLTAILLGYSVIAIPRANYNDIPTDLLQGRKWVFIDDDDGKNSMVELYDSIVCDKVWFNHQDFKKITKCDSKDLSDYTTQFKSKSEWGEAFDSYINSLDVEKMDAMDIIRNMGEYATREFIKEVEDVELNFYDVLPTQQITIFVGEPNVGKSAFTLAVANDLFDKDIIDNMMYMDMDNSIAYTKDRIIRLMDRNGDNKVMYYSGSTTSKDRLFEIMKQLIMIKKQGLRTLIVIDSLANFIDGSINDDKVVKELFQLLQDVRDNFGATIIVLHHTKKGKKEDGSSEFIGTQIIRSSPDTMYYVSKEDKYIILKLDKARSMVRQSGAFELDFDKMEVAHDESYEPKEKGEREATSDEVMEVLRKHRKMTQKAMSKELGGKWKTAKELLKEKGMIKVYNEDNIWMVELKSEDYSDEPIVVEFCGEF